VQLLALPTGIRELEERYSFTPSDLEFIAVKLCFLRHPGWAWTIVLLTPQELEEFAEVERIEKESKATISEPLEKAKGRRISGWRDKEPAEVLAILEKLTPEDREFFRCCYPEELEQYSMALRALGKAQLAKADFYRIAERRAG
jgi:hypothetical protein